MIASPRGDRENYLIIPEEYYVLRGLYIKYSNSRKVTLRRRRNPKTHEIEEGYFEEVRDSYSYRGNFPERTTEGESVVDNTSIEHVLQRCDNTGRFALEDNERGKEQFDLPLDHGIVKLLVYEHVINENGSRFPQGEGRAIFLTFQDYIRYGKPIKIKAT